MIENLQIFGFPKSMLFVQIGAGELPDDTTLVCSRGSDRFAFLSFKLCIVCSCEVVPRNHFYAAGFQWIRFLAKQKGLYPLSMNVSS